MNSEKGLAVIEGVNPTDLSSGGTTGNEFGKGFGGDRGCVLLSKNKHSQRSTSKIYTRVKAHLLLSDKKRS